MKNFKKVLALALALSMILSTMTTAFAAVANTDKADVLHQLGLMDGKSTESFVPALEDEATAPEALKLIGTALGWVVDADATTTFTDVEPWAVPWVAKAVELGITNGVSETEFGSDVIDGQRLVTWFLRALGYDMTQAWEDTATLAATAGISIPTATLRDDVVGVIWEGLKSTPVGAESTLIETIIRGDAAKTAIAEDAGLVDATLAIVSTAAVGIKVVEIKLNKAVDTATTTVQIKKGAAIYSSAVVWNDAKNTATATLVTNLPTGTLTAYVMTADETLSADFEVVDQAAASIQVTTTEIANAASQTVEYAVKNQYGETMDVVNTLVTATAYDVTAGEVVPLTFNGDTNKFAVTDITALTGEALGDVIRVTVSYLGMTTQANLTLIAPSEEASFSFGDVTLSDSNDARLEVSKAGHTLAYDMFDQYGEEATLDSYLVADADGDANIELIGGVLFSTSNANIIDPDTFTVDADGVLSFNTGNTAGSVIITAIINATGYVTQTTIVVNAAATLDSVAIAAPTAIIAGGEAVELALTGLDQFGAATTDFSAIDTITSSDDAVIDDAAITTKIDDTKNLLKFTTESNGTLSAKTATLTLKDGDVVLGTITVSVEPDAKAESITAVSFPQVFEINASKELAIADVTVLDQYGRAFTPGAIAVTEKTDAGNYTSLPLANTVHADAAGTTTFEVKADAQASTAFTFDVTVVATASITSYAIDAVGTIWDQDGLGTSSAHDVDLNLVGKTAAGKTVQLVTNKITSATTTDAGIATVVVAGGVATVTGEGAGTATIKVWNGAGFLADVAVTVSDVNPSVQSVSFNSPETTVTNGGTVTLEDNVVLLDQYGVDLAGAGVVALYAIDPATDGFWTLSASISGVPTEANGVITEATCVVGEVITVGYVTANGQTATTEVEVN